MPSIVEPAVQNTIDRAFGPTSGLSLSRLCATLVLLVCLYIILGAVYNLTLHPLSHFPGPKLHAISRIPWWIVLVNGDEVSHMQALHAKYGPIVRSKPNELSYIDRGGDAWHDIFGHEKGRRENGKVQEYHLQPFNGVHSIISAEYDDHRRMRRLFSPAFSDRALRSQQPLFMRHADLLVTKMESEARAGYLVDMVKVLNCTTFDIMGDLVFGQPLGMLENNDYSPWLKAVYQSVRVYPYIHIVETYPVLKALATAMEPKRVTQMKSDHFKYSADRVDERLKKGSDQPDVWNLVMNAQEGEGLSIEEMHSNSELFLLAGSETTGSLLSALTYLLLRNPEKMERLKQEVRTTFKTEEDIEMGSLAGLEYLNACIQEALRVHPPVPVGPPRRIPPGGQTILGQYLPPGTIVCIRHYNTYHYPGNFHNPETFAPERWMPNPPAEYANDKLESAQPFNFGPRNCIGQNMAKHEMRLLYSKILWRFDLEIPEEAPWENWLDQKVYALWEKKPLICRVNLRNTSP